MGGAGLTDLEYFQSDVQIPAGVSLRFTAAIRPANYFASSVYLKLGSDQRIRHLRESTMNYSKLDREDFDAIVTGELTHYAIWLEDELNGIICDYFIDDSDKTEDFKRLFLYRDGLTFQDKIDIVRAMIPLFGAKSETLNIKRVLTEVEKYKTWRNAMAHGLDVSDDKPRTTLRIQTFSRSGKGKELEITPKSHQAKMDEAGKLLESPQNTRRKLKSM